MVGVIAVEGGATIFVLFLFFFSLFCAILGGVQVREGGWPASFEGRRYVIHAFLMMLLGVLLVGLVTGHELILRGTVFTFGILLIVLNWDLIVFDTKEKYEKKSALRKQELRASESARGSNRLMRILEPTRVMLVLMALTFTFTVIVEYDRFVTQLSEWLG